MVNAYPGTLVTCDVPIKQFILHLDEQQQREAGWDSFVVQDLDETHLLVQEERLAFIQDKLTDLQDSNAYQRTEEGNAPPPPKRVERSRKRAEPAAPSGE